MSIKTVFWLAFAALLAGGCASPGRTPLGRQPDEVVSAPAALPALGEVAMVALALLGKPYLLGGMSPDTGFDCSGLVHYAYREALRLSLPRTTLEQSRASVPIPLASLEAGDLLFFNTQAREFSHVGIYLGGGRFIHAPATGGFVRVESVQASYWTRRFNGARRIIF